MISEVVETIITEGSEDKDDIYLPILTPKHKDSKTSSGAQCDTNVHSKCSNMNSHIEIITTESNTKSIVEFDALFCSELRISRIKESTKNLGNVDKTDFLTSRGVILQSDRKQMLSAYKSLERLTQRGQKLRKQNTNTLNDSSVYCSPKNCTFSGARTPSIVPVFSKKSMKNSKVLTRKVSVQEYVSLSISTNRNVTKERAKLVGRPKTVQNKLNYTVSYNPKKQFSGLKKAPKRAYL